MGYANPQFLVNTESLAARLGDPVLRVFDCTVHLLPGDGRGYRVVSGRPAFDESHIPGAGFLDVPGELSDPASPLPFTFPPPERFAAAMSRHGVESGTSVVLYAADGATMWAARVWWMLRAFGFDSAAILDGGFGKWTKEGRPVSAAPCAYPPARFEPQLRAGLIADRARVLGAIGDSASCIINALPERSHRGEGASPYGRPGRIASSVNAPFHRLVGREDGTFLPAEELRARFAEAGLRPEQRAITYCGGGIAASQDAFALVLIGHPDVALYDGSLSEWAADPKLPMETG